jgi:carbamoyl-phosphate synthase large subunit
MTAILLTGVGKRYDIVSAFAQHATTIAVDPNPLAPAQYAAHVRAAAPLIDDPGYVPALAELCERHDVGAVIPLTDLDIEVLAHARVRDELPALVPDPEIARATYDKYETHLLLERLGLPSPPTVLPGEHAPSHPVMVKPRRGSGARSIHYARDAREADFFVGYVDEPVMIQRAMDGPEFSIDCLSDTLGRAINAIPREIGLGITDVNTRFGGAFPAPMYAALEGRTYPELIVAMARGEAVEPHVGEYRSGMTFTRYYWQLELDERLEPTGRDIVPGGPPPPR